MTYSFHFVTLKGNKIVKQTNSPKEAASIWEQLSKQGVALYATRQPQTKPF